MKRQIETDEEAKEEVINGRKKIVGPRVVSDGQEPDVRRHKA
jgi:hypothetical protein